MSHEILGYIYDPDKKFPKDKVHFSAGPFRRVSLGVIKSVKREDAQALVPAIQEQAKDEGYFIIKTKIIYEADK